MFDLSQKNWRARQGVWASLALVACVLGGVGCAEMDDDDAYLETQEQSIEMQQAVAEPALGQQLPGELSAGELEGEVKAKGTWGMDLQANPVFGGEYMHVNWRAESGENFKLCWKKVSDSGTVCSNNKYEITAGGPDYSWGRQHAQFPTQCGTEYKIRVKSFLKYKTVTATSAACNPAYACPSGGWFDGANCQIGQAPSGTSAFIYQNSFYYTYSNGATKCPLAGSYDDSANCFVQNVPSGVNAFIYNNHWYYEAYP